jgi:hypothetical protein
MSEQLYLVQLTKMMTSDEADAALSWSAVVAENDLGKIALSDAASLLTMKLDDCSLFTGLRPMTQDEVREWREEND